MRFLDDLSLGRKLVIIITAISGTALLIACLLVISYDVHRFRINQVEQLSLLADVLGQNSAAAMAFNDRQAAADILASSRFASSVSGVCLYLQDGLSFAGYSRENTWTCAKAPPKRGAEILLRRADAGAARRGQRRTGGHGRDPLTFARVEPAPAALWRDHLLRSAELLGHCVFSSHAIATDHHPSGAPVAAHRSRGFSHWRLLTSCSGRDRRRNRAAGNWL